ncbi:hypothetical protein CL629_00215 [bacterium]|nr:hypothetical protein [bacterium]|tara:strand:- start:2014 stop:2403 length:390 start_codon:yes stop_codon:yes gene_type:complete
MRVLRRRKKPESHTTDKHGRIPFYWIGARIRFQSTQANLTIEGRVQNGHVYRTPSERKATLLVIETEEAAAPDEGVREAIVLIKFTDAETWFYAGGFFHDDDPRKLPTLESPPEGLVPGTFRRIFRRAA